jgi:hypothetical protein
MPYSIVLPTYNDMERCELAVPLNSALIAALKMNTDEIFTDPDGNQVIALEKQAGSASP